MTARRAVAAKSEEMEKKLAKAAKQAEKDALASGLPVPKKDKLSKADKAAAAAAAIAAATAAPPKPKKDKKAASSDAPAEALADAAADLSIAPAAAE